MSASALAYWTPPIAKCPMKLGLSGVWFRAQHAHKALPGDAIVFTVYEKIPFDRLITRIH